MCEYHLSSLKGISTAYSRRHTYVTSTTERRNWWTQTGDLERPKVTMSEMVDSTRDESMIFPEPLKPGQSDDLDPTKAAKEILSAMDENSPECKKVKDLVQMLEEMVKKPAPGSGASSTAGSFALLGSGDDPMNKKSPRSKKPAAGGGSRVLSFPFRSSRSTRRL